jgi:hypothetical protein
MRLAEKRLAPRRNANIEAVIRFGTSRVSCSIRNVSDGGAKLELSSVRGVPNTFDLLVPNHVPQPCRVAWRSLKELGVSFTGPTAIRL